MTPATDRLRFGHTDGMRACSLSPAPASAVTTMLLCAIARVVAETDWPALDPDTLTQLLDTLAFTAAETLATIDLTAVTQ